MSSEENFEAMTLGELSIKLHNMLSEGKTPSEKMIQSFNDKALLVALDDDPTTFEQLFISVMEVDPEGEVAESMRLSYDRLGPSTKHYCEDILGIAPPTL